MIKKLLLLCTIIAICNCSSALSLLKEPPVATRKIISLNDADSFIPKQLKDTSSDFITNALKYQVPDTIPDSLLYNADAPVFDPIPVDSGYVVDSLAGILLCEKDMSLYINDYAWRKYLQVEVNARKNFSKELIIGAIGAEKLFKEAVEESAVNYDELYNSYMEERSRKTTWKMISGGTLLLFVGFISASVIK